LYGLKQAGFEWSEELEKFFLDAEYTHSQVDQVVYFHRISDEHTVITVSVDDMAITSYISDTYCKGNLTNLRRILYLSLAKGNPKRTL
jgi:hypothetical protein